jgi:hypothetical protein
MRLLNRLFIIIMANPKMWSVQAATVTSIRPKY